LPEAEKDGGNGAGGDSGSSHTFYGGGGGGGGAGGYGAIVTASSAGSTSVNITGGFGGDGGAGGDGTGGGIGGGGNGGNGGDGGIGLLFSGSAVLTNQGVITGGNGGNGGNAGNGGSGISSGGDGGSGGNGGIGLSLSGTTLVNTGTITGGNGGAGGSGGTGTAITGNVGASGSGGAGIAGSNLIIDNSGGTISGGISGDGARADAIQFTGGTNTLRLNSTSTIIGGIRNGGTSLTIDQSGNISLNGTITGAGNLTKMGTGILTLNGTNTYNGDTIVNDGTLKAGSTSAFGASHTYTVNGGTLDLGAITSLTMSSLSGAGAGAAIVLGTAALTVDQSSVTTFDGIITGTTGSLTKTGTGTLILNGANTYTGVTEVSAGTLEVGDAVHPSAKIAGNATVDPGATLRGHGTITGNVDNNDGIVWPGGSIGTLTVKGNYTQSSNGTLMIDVSPTAASQLKVGGTATLDGTLSLLYGPGTYTTRTYTLVDAGSVTGKFTKVVDNKPSGVTTETMTYTPATVVLGITGTVVNPVNATIFGNVGSAILRASQEANDALLERAALACTSRSSTSSSGMSPNTGCTGKPLWLYTNGTFTHVDGNNGAPGVHENRYGFLMGVDHAFGAWTAGVAAGYSHSDLSESDDDATGKIDTARLAIYGGRTLGAVNLAGTASYAYDFTSTERDFPGFGDTNDDSHAQEFTAALRAGIPLTISPTITLTPHVGLRYANVHGLAANESGLTSQQLNTESQTLQSLQPYTDITLDYAFKAGDTDRLSHLRVRAGYAYETLSTNRDVTVTSNDGTPFVVPGTEDSRNIFTAGLGLDMPVGKTTRVYARYDAVLPIGNVTAQRAQVGVSARF
jgi:outer membrane autotransporter protein